MQQTTLIPLFIFIGLLSMWACGVKAPPLAPERTPPSSAEGPKISPSPFPSPSPSPAPKKKKRTQ